jgi:RNA polymerase sigma-70 factor (sigma-E family)
MVCQPPQSVARGSSVITTLLDPTTAGVAPMTQPQPELQPDTGDPASAAVTRLYAGHYTRLVRVAVLLLGDQGLAEDVVQDAFVDLHGRWSRLREPELAAAYLRRSVLNRSRSALRHRAVVARDTAHARHVLVDVPAAEQSALASATRERVLQALAELPTRQREVLVLRYYLDLTEHQIAEALGIGRGSVKTHASRGAAALRTSLEDQR